MEQVTKIAQALYDKKAEHIDVLDIHELTSLGEYFIICSCSSTTQVKACVDEVEERMSAEGFAPKHKEGYQGGTWVLMDFGNIIVHVMQAETREFYSLERLWEDAVRIEIDLK